MVAYTFYLTRDIKIKMSDHTTEEIPINSYPTVGHVSITTKNQRQ
jgi:hypothetical protein